MISSVRAVTRLRRQSRCSNDTDAYHLSLHTCTGALLRVIRSRYSIGSPSLPRDLTRIFLQRSHPVPVAFCRDAQARLHRCIRTSTSNQHRVCIDSTVCKWLVSRRNRAFGESAFVSLPKVVVCNRCIT